jgi:hypothetical protein
MKKELFNRIYQLLCIKSLVTLIIVIACVVMATTNKEVPEWLQNILITVVAFYFGTQHSKVTPEIKEEK